MLSIRKLNFSVKQYFSPNKIKNLSPFYTDVAIRFHPLRTLGTGAAIEKS